MDIIYATKQIHKQLASAADKRRQRSKRDPEASKSRGDYRIYCVHFEWRTCLLNALVKYLQLARTARGPSIFGQHSASIID